MSSRAAVTGSELRVHAVDGIQGSGSPAGAASRQRIGCKPVSKRLCASFERRDGLIGRQLRCRAPRGDLDSELAAGKAATLDRPSLGLADYSVRAVALRQVPLLALTFMPRRW
jgi:hypothetical protein